MKKYDDFEDDGRTVADMSFFEESHSFSLRRFKRKGERKTTHSASDEMSSEDRRIYLKAALASALLIAAIFIAGAALFILFCQHIWLK